MTRYAAIERARRGRGGPDLTQRASNAPEPRNGPAFARTDWGVIRAWEDGSRAPEVVRSRLTALEATAVAGQLRDRMTDAQCGEGWNYVARALGGRYALRVPVPRNFQGRRER